MITYLRFHTPVNVGSTDHTEWARDRPQSTTLASRITPRMGDPTRRDVDGNPEIAGDVILEYRAGADNYDVTVPRPNIAQIIRPPAPAHVAKEKAK